MKEKQVLFILKQRFISMDSKSIWEKKYMENKTYFGYEDKILNISPGQYIIILDRVDYKDYNYKIKLCNSKNVNLVKKLRKVEEYLKENGYEGLIICNSFNHAYFLIKEASKKINFTFNQLREYFIIISYKDVVSNLKNFQFSSEYFRKWKVKAITNRSQEEHINRVRRAIKNKY